MDRIDTLCLQLERIANALERLADSAPGSYEREPQASSPMPKLRAVKTNGTPTTPRSVVTTAAPSQNGSAYGVSNLLFYQAAPRIIERLTRDDRALGGVLTITLDEDCGLTRESRARILARLQKEFGLVELVGVRPGSAPRVRVVDADAARAWLASARPEQGVALP